MNQEAVSSKNKFRDLKKPASALLEPRVFWVLGREEVGRARKARPVVAGGGHSLVPPPGLSVGTLVLPTGGLWAWVGGKEVLPSGPWALASAWPLASVTFTSPQNAGCRSLILGRRSRGEGVQLVGMMSQGQACRSRPSGRCWLWGVDPGWTGLRGMDSGGWT